MLGVQLSPGHPALPTPALVEGWRPAAIGPRPEPGRARGSDGWWGEGGTAGTREPGNLGQGPVLSGRAQVWPDKFIKCCGLPTARQERAGGPGQEGAPGR